MKIYTLFFYFCLAGLGLVTGCASPHEGRILKPMGIYDEFQWTEHELLKDVAIRKIGQTDEFSTHIVRLKGSEEPHRHDKHDLMVFMMRGKAKIHFEDYEVDLYPGDVLEIPKTAFHWAENKSKESSLAYVTFHPPFDGFDIVPVSDDGTKILRSKS